MDLELNFVNNKKIYAIFLFVFLLCGNVFAKADIIGLPKKKGPVAYGINAYPPLAEQIIDSEVGTIVTFGNYEQDANIDNGKEAVEWIILDINNNDRTAILISKYLIDCLQYNSIQAYVTWENSSLRAYMNSTMLYDMFSDEERKCIKCDEISNIPNPYFNDSIFGNQTNDYLYIPGIEDIIKYFSNSELSGDAFYNEILEKNPLRMCSATEYAIKHGLRVLGNKSNFSTYGNYFLRTNGKNGSRVWYNDVYATYFESYITEYGEFKPYGTGVHSTDDGIRPMVKVCF